MSNGATSPGRYRILLSKDAHKYYDRLPGNQTDRVDRGLFSLSRDPYQGGDIKKLQNLAGYYRLRVGDLRIIFEIHEKQKAVWVNQILPRGQAYK
ncbi:type II toxin-antitoxin system RelE/ParE family toxin [Candidatus Berkelbacteria bacterium]|nr:type II toxin-antitoxin system RelE/ParE family toxin [Candidatus Berkelbacteria bacterium]